MEKNGNMSFLCRKNSCCIQNILTLGKKNSYLSHSKTRKTSKESGNVPAESETHVLLIHFRAFWIYLFATDANSKLKTPSISAYAMYSLAVEPTFK